MNLSPEQFHGLNPNQPETLSLADGPVSVKLGKDYELLVAKTDDIDGSLMATNKYILNTQVPAYVIAPEEMDINQDIGFKALRPGEVVEIGRERPGRFNLDDYISRRHVEIGLSEDGEVITVLDLGSTNGTFIGQQALRQSVEIKQGQAADEKEITPEKLTNKFSFNGVSEPNPRHPEYNDDNEFYDEESRAFGVFDGVGGSPGSDLASKIASESVKSSLAKAPNDLPEALATTQLAEALQNAHFAITSEGNGDIQTTATIAQMFEPENGEPYIAIASAGDSRAYLLRNENLEIVTLDHGVFFSQDESDQRHMQATLADAVDLSRLTLQEQKLFDNRNAITSCLGSSDENLKIATTTIKVQPGDKILLTTDGIHDNLTTSEIRSILVQDGQSEELVAAAKWRAQDKEHIRSKYDDMTAVIMSVPKA